MPEHLELASNPIAPDVGRVVEHRDHKLSNSDFRKLLMTPRPAHNLTAQSDEQVTKHKQQDNSNTQDKVEKRRRNLLKDTDDSANQNQSQKVISRRPHFSRNKKDVSQDGINSSDIATPRYRDRAKERRDGKVMAAVDDSGQEDKETIENEDEMLSKTADYRAVAPSSAAGESHAERRRVIIQESKYLGGDMEHTHLVKGLDYVLLQKVRLEIQNKELEAEQVLDAELEKPEVSKEQIIVEDNLQFRTRIAASICDLLFHEKPCERNEYFQPGRMAYRIELEDDSVDFEVPATVIRSKSDCLQLDGRGSAEITTNEIVINKLTQILSYLRAGKRLAKKAKLKGRYVEKDESGSMHSRHNKLPATNIDVFDGAGRDYIPSTGTRTKSAAAAAQGNEHSIEDGEQTKQTGNAASRPKASYFEVPGEPDNQGATAGAAGPEESLVATKEFMHELNQRFRPKDGDKTLEKASLERFFAKTKVTCYDECYPGFAESYDAMGDSDDEADFSKMDLGNKKGPVGRWDFETQEEYSDYMSNKEAMPKAAFQYGVKMSDGRRTRRLGQKDEKAELDRQLQKIQSIIQRRKQVSDEGEPVAKNPRF